MVFDFAKMTKRINQHFLRTFKRTNQTKLLSTAFNLETAVGRAGVCDFCELSLGGEMPAYPTWGAVQGATRAWLLPL